MIKFAITHTNKDGLRQLTRANQGRNHFDNKDDAENYLANVKEEFRKHLLGDAADTLEVRQVECYAHGDAKHVYFDE